MCLDVRVSASCCFVLCNSLLNVDWSAWDVRWCQIRPWDRHGGLGMQPPTSFDANSNRAPVGKRGALNLERQTRSVAGLHVIDSQRCGCRNPGPGFPCGAAGSTLCPVTMWQLFRCRKSVRVRRYGTRDCWPPTGQTANLVAVVYSADIPVPPGFNVEWAFITKTTHGCPCSRFFRIACPCPNASANAVEVGNEAELPVQGPISLPSHRRARRCQQSGKSRGRLPRHRSRPRGRRLRLRGRNSTVMWAGISS